MERIYITPSEVVEYLYCPRFIYFMNCLCIPQHEEKRYKVLKGREVHGGKVKINKNYLRRKLGCKSKEISVHLCSDKYHLNGIIDEVLFLEDDTAAPLDYKFAKYKDRLFRTHKYQSVLYALLIKDNYSVEVQKGYVCYIRSRNLVREIEFKKNDFRKATEIIEEILRIIQMGFYPKKTSSPVKCIDCCYKNICT